MAGTRRDWIVGMALVAGLLGGHRLASAEEKAAFSQPVSAGEAPSMRVLLRIELRETTRNSGATQSRPRKRSLVRFMRTPAST